VLKIDKSFVNGVADEGVDRSIVRAIRSGHGRLPRHGGGAEGIERPAQRDALIRAGLPARSGLPCSPRAVGHEATRRLTEAGLVR